jgi:hypothetical protein
LPKEYLFNESKGNIIQVITQFQLIFSIVDKSKSELESNSRSIIGYQSKQESSLKGETNQGQNKNSLAL